MLDSRAASRYLAAPMGEPADGAPGRLHLIDGSGYIFRAFYAVRNLSTAAGEPTNALHGFSQMLEKTLRDEAPTHLAVVFDSGKPSFRSEIYPAYKATRDAPPEDLVAQVPAIFELVGCLNIKTFIEEGVEADDVIATLTKQAVESGWQVRIISGDKDLMQLVTDRVELFEPMRNKRYDAAEVASYDRLLVPPEQVRDALALAGDSSDNVPGVRGVGPKKAAQLLGQFGDLESVLAAAARGEVKGKIGEVLAASAAEARLSRELVSLRFDVPLDLPEGLDSLRRRDPDADRLNAFCRRWELRGLSPEAPAAGEVAPASVHIDRTVATTVETEAQFEALLERLLEAELVGVAVETSSLRILDSTLLGLGFAVGASEAAHVPFGPEGSISAPEALARLSPLLSDRRRRVVCHESKLLAGLLEREGIPLSALAFDPSLAAYLLDPDDPSSGPEAIARRYLGHEALPRAKLLAAGKKRRSYAEAPLSLRTEHLGERALIAWHAEAVLAPLLEQTATSEVLESLELPLVPVLARIELAGMHIDLERLSRMKTRFDAELERLEHACHAAAGRPFLIGSPKQLRTILFEELGLKIHKTTKTGPSTDHAALEAIEDDHPLPRAVIEHRTVQKLQNTYVEALPRMVAPSSGRVHTQLNQATAATGRLSSNDPNLQNIPIRTELGRELRKVFVAAPGHLLVSVDYSQVELRVLAHLSEDEVLLTAFREGADVHARTASVLFEVPPDAVTREQRTQAKAVNFGVLYGMGASRLARELKINRRTASQFVADYFERQPGVRRYIDRTLEQARTDGEVRTLLGRRRLVPDIGSRSRAARAAAERVAINTPIQGSAADLIKLAMLRVDAVLREERPNVRLVLQVHDELVLEAPEAEAEAVAEAVKDAMQRAYPLAVPLVADAHFGANWDEAH